MLGAFIGAGTSLLGGILGRKDEKKAIEAQNAYNLPVNQRKRWEDAKVNPAVFMAPGGDLQTATGGTNYMGRAVADAGAMIAQGLSDRSAERKQINDLTQENAKLRKATNKIALRPTTPGIYGDSGQGEIIDGEYSYIDTEDRFTSDGQLRPKTSPWKQRGEVDFPVTDYAGNLRYMARGAAERLQLTPYQMVIGEDIEAIVGESPVSEGLNAANSPAALGAFGGAITMPSAKQLAINFGLPLAQNDSTDPRKWSRQKQREVYGYVPDGFDEYGGEYYPYSNQIGKGAKAPALRIGISP